MSANNYTAGGRAASHQWGLQRWHYWLLLAGLLLRLAYCVSVNREAAFGGWDGHEYHAYAQNLRHGLGDDYPRFFNSVRAPGYPLFLVPFVALSATYVWPIQIAQCLLGLLQAWLLAKIAARWAGRRAGHWAFVIGALHPFLIYYCAFIQTENLFMTLLWAGIYGLQRAVDKFTSFPRGWLASAAVIFGLGCLTRPALQPFMVVAVLWLGIIVWRQSNFLAAIGRMALFTALVCVLLVPWMLRNEVKYHELTLSPHGAQIVYAQSNSPEYLQTYEAKTKDEYYRALTALHLRYAITNGIPPAQWLADAHQFRTEHHDDWLRLQRHKFAHFWTPWLNPLIFPRFQFLLSVFTLTPLYFISALELFRRRRQPDALLWLLLGLIAVGYLVGGFLFHVQVRYRIPYVDMSFMILTASWLGWVTSRRKSAPASAERPARILWISCVGEKGGAEVYMINLFRHLDRQRFTPAVALLRPGPLAEELRQLNVEVFELPAHRMRQVGSVAKAIWSLHRIIRRHGFDLVTSNGFRGHVYGGLAAGLADVPETWVVHTAEKPALSTRAILQIPTDHVIANSPRTADYFVEHGCATSLIWPSVDLAQLQNGTSREELAARYHIPASARWVCMGARMQRYKGHEHFLRALAGWPPDAGAVQGIIMGGTLFGMESAYPGELQQLAKNLGLESRVNFTGFVSDADLSGLLQACELLVHPALDEDFGIIIAEAQALGKPVLAFAVTGPSAIIEPEVTGRLSPAGDPAAFAQAFADLLRQPQRLRQWGEAGRERTLRAFAAPQAARQLERVYAACLDRRSGVKVGHGEADRIALAGMK